MQAAPDKMIVGDVKKTVPAHFLCIQREGSVLPGQRSIQILYEQPGQIFCGHQCFGVQTKGLPLVRECGGERPACLPGLVLAAGWGQDFYKRVELVTLREC